MFGQITYLEILREVERRGLYTSALVEPPVEPIREIVVPEPDIIFPSDERPEYPEEQVIVYPRLEEEQVPYIPIVIPPHVTVPAIEIPEKPFALTKTHVIAGAALLAVIYLFGAKTPSTARAAVPKPAGKAKTRTFKPF